MILTQLNIEAHLSPEEVEFVDAERERMDKEEPISLPWSRESVLEAWLQITIDRRRGVDQDPILRELLIAAGTVLDGLHARIESAQPHAVPVFDGIADLAVAVNRANGLKDEA